MSEAQKSETALELLTVWFEEEFARGRCDAWERYFAPDVEVTTSTGEVLGTLADWCAAYARAVNDRPLIGAVATLFMGGEKQKYAKWVAGVFSGKTITAAGRGTQKEHAADVIRSQHETEWLCQRRTELSLSR